jgi:hypothetical protein
LDHLKARGITGIAICEAQWIAAPVSGYLIDALGNATIDGAKFSTFRIGIRDGREEEHGLPAGEVFVFIAHGREDSGGSAWYPHPGPDHEPGPEEAITEGMLAYEFLIGRERFESLTTRYP